MESKKNKVLIAMPCYNSMDTVLMAIESVAKQTHRNYLLVCCDDNSTDSTYEVLNSKHFDYELMRNANNQGTGNTVNRVFEKYDDNSFEFMTWVSADNVLATEFLSKHVKKLNEGCAITYCGWSRFTNDVNRISASYVPNPNLLHLKEVFTLGPGFLFRKKLWDKVKPFEKLPGEDYYFAVKCALANAKFGYINQSLVKYKDHKNSVTWRLHTGEIKGQCSGPAMSMAQDINVTNGKDGCLI